MIKLLLSGKQLLLFIIIAWSLLIYVGYNVLTVDASSSSKENYDYDSYEEYNEIVEPICKDHGGKIDYGSGECMFKNDSREKAIVFEKELDDRGLGSDYTAEEEASWNQKAEAEIAAKEDAICDDEDADTTDIKSCMSASRQQQAAHNYDKESCEEVNGDWNKKKGSGCTFYEDEQQDILDAAEEQRKIIDEEEQKALAAIDEYNALQAQEQQEEDFLREENVEKSIGFPGENEPGFIKTPEQKKAEEQEFIAELEDDLFDAKTPEQKEKIQGQLDKAREKFGPYKDEEKLTGYDEEGRQLNVINGDYDEEPEQIEDYGNTVSEEQIKEEAKKITDSEPWTNYPIEQKPVEEEVSEQDEEEVADNNEEADNQVNTDTEDSSDNNDSSDSQDSSDSEDNSSDDGGDSSDSGDASSSSDDGGDSGESSESEE